MPFVTVQHGAHLAPKLNQAFNDLVQEYCDVFTPGEFR